MAFPGQVLDNPVSGERFAPHVVRAATAPLVWLATRRGLARRYQVPGMRDLPRARRRRPARPGEGRAAAGRPWPGRPSTPRKQTHP